MRKPVTMPTEWRTETGGVAGGLKVKAVYGVAELARAAGVSRQFLHRLLPAAGVKLVRVRGFVLVPLDEIRRRIPWLWNALIALEVLRLEARSVVKERRKIGRTE
jgi:hypothetical protein